MAKSRRFYRDLQRILRVKKWRRSENFNRVGILRICGVTAERGVKEFLIVSYGESRFLCSRVAVQCRGC